MAVDTRDKRMAMIGLAKPYVRLMKDPDGSIDGPARAMLLFLYSGITLSSVITTLIPRLMLMGAGCWIVWVLCR